MLSIDCCSAVVLWAEGDVGGGAMVMFVMHGGGGSLMVVVRVIHGSGIT